jgi:hypothetical protein
MTGNRVRKIDCNADRPATERIVEKIKAGGNQVIVLHRDVAFTDNPEQKGLYCCACGDGPLGRVTSDNRYRRR